MFLMRKPMVLSKIHTDLHINNNFSISLDKWINCEQITFITVTIYSVQTEYPFQIESHVLFTIELNKLIDWEYYFTEFNLQNCTAALLNFELENDSLSYFLEVNSKFVSNLK